MGVVTRSRAMIYIYKITYKYIDISTHPPHIHTLNHAAPPAAGFLCVNLWPPGESTHFSSFQESKRTFPQVGSLVTMVGSNPSTQGRMSCSCTAFDWINVGKLGKCATISGN